MNKQEAIFFCKVLLYMGVYAVPVKYSTFGNEYVIRVNHVVDSYGFSMPNLCGYKFNFMDCWYTRFEGKKTQDFPVFYTPDAL